MSIVAAIAAFVVGVAFLVAGPTKLAAGPVWVAQAGTMGVPRPLAVAVPWIELVLGAALVARLAMPIPAIVSAVLLSGFTVLIARHLAAGEHPPCACFGTWSAKPLGPGHLVRNLALVALSVLACWA
jgi:uncharacterized membrane protein YphA (DoxX/SURF4 family)